ncbi:hypothetical protein CFII64_16562 [Pseudomonas sp. CFII64]|uniref:hypothetical protein n=1 Tax=Pseudomonas sp. CFII64 TaxID=911242 RepID=UPI0003580ADE|nr:hypothetical protein [Pseudomonas sp. CFII64]EPJ82385.1 hypothetical protein CFII64_16562 [Pseudomonas sp. CFII64]
MKTNSRIVLTFLVMLGSLIAWMVNTAPNAALTPRTVGEEVHAGTFEEPRLIDEPAWPGAVFLTTAGDSPAFFTAEFSSEPDKPNPAFPDTAQSNTSWTYAGQHSGIGADLKPFTERTRVGALHVAQIDSKHALLRSRIDRVPDAQTPYPSTAESNDFWDFIGFFEKPGTEIDPKSSQDLVWPGVFVSFEPSKKIYVARRIGRPASDGWPAPDTEDGAGYWKYAGAHTAIPVKFPKPWSARSTDSGSSYVNEDAPPRRYFYATSFIGFPAILGAAFPQGAQSDRYWAYRGRHSGFAHDPKNFGEVAGAFNNYRGLIEGRWAQLSPLFEGDPSPATPFPKTLKGNEFWRVIDDFQHAGSWQNPKNDEDNFTSTDEIHVQPQGSAHAIFRALTSGFRPADGWDYSDAEKWQLLGTSLHGGTVADPKGTDELTWPGAVHVATIESKQVFFASRFEGVPAEQNKPLPTAAASNEYWNHIPVIEPLGTFESPRRFADYSQSGSVYVDGFLLGQRAFYISRFEGFPADDIDGFANVGTADPNWVYAGKHAGVMTDLKPFDDVTRVGAIHEGLIDGQRVLLRSRFAGAPSSATPYPETMVSNDHWEFIGVFKHAGTAQDMKGRDDFTWPGALHLDETQQLVFAATKQGEPGTQGWVYPVGETSDENWTFVTSMATPGTADAPRGRNGLSAPGVIFADQQGLSRQRLYRARFAGFAAEVGAVYPSGTASNEFYEYAGEHAGTFKDPKPFTDPTWHGAIHLTTINAELTFFKSKITGMPSSETPYPETPVSNDFWTFAFSTLQAGTAADPKAFIGQTWPGAIHEDSELGQRYLFEAQQFGNPYSDGWPEPGNDTQYWRRLGRVIHKGSFEDPKEAVEYTYPGSIHTTTDYGDVVYYRSLFEGKPAPGWLYPAPGTSNESWEYLGRNLPEGTWADPKDAGGFTWPGRIHSLRVGDKRLYLASKVDGLLAEHDWPVPEAGENAFWSVVGESRHSGDYASPKDQAEVTWVGAIHAKPDGELRRYYRSKVAGNLAAIGDSFPLPALPGESNAWWEYIGISLHAGTLEDPMLGAVGVIIWPGAIAKINRAGQDEYFMARFGGLYYNEGRLYPDPGQSNSDWGWVGKDVAPGTLESPKDANEITWPAAIHRFEVDGKEYYVRSKMAGAPGPAGWQFPSPPTSDGRWEYLDMGVHAGNWDDPKPFSDNTWPGAIHIQMMYVQVGEFKAIRRWFYRAKFWGRGSDHEGGYSNSEFFDALGLSYYMGTLDSPKYFDQPTWAGAIHLDRQTHFLFEAKKGGEMGVELGAPPTTATDTDSWRFLGVNLNSGKLDDPKQWDEYTWPGRIHRYDYGGKVLFFIAQMTGTPSEKNWHYPTDESSNDYWAFYGSTAHAGTYSDPHQRNEVTWKGAIHLVNQNNTILYFAAKRSGNAEIDGWQYPSTPADNEYFTYKGQWFHEGTIVDPKGINEPVWPGVYVKTNNEGADLYFIAMNAGIPSLNNWPFPAEGSNNAHWTYYGSSRHAGTLTDPKQWNDVSWQGAVHVIDTAEMHMLFSVASDRVGIPENDNWTLPRNPIDHEEVESEPGPPLIPGRFPAWKFLSVTHKNGTLENPKSTGEWTLTGLIHSATVAHQSMLFKSKFDGKYDYPDAEPVKTVPEIGESNQWWEFLRKGQGTQIVPNGFNDYSFVGDVNVYFYAGKHDFFRAKTEGRPSDYNWYYPTVEADNTHWTYLSRNEGTLSDPKTWNQESVIGDVHRYEYGDKTLFFTAKYDGNPSRHTWYYPVTAVSNEYWTYIGLHAGTWQDPKNWDEPTWPGAIHWYREKNLYFSSLVAGVPSDNSWYYPTSEVSNANWQYIDNSRYAAPGINDLTRTYDQYTWVAAHNAFLDDMKTQLDRGVRGFWLDIHFDHHSTAPEVRICHPAYGKNCGITDPSLRDILANVFLPYLRANPFAIVTIEFESTVTRAAMQDVFSRVPELADYSYTNIEGVRWRTLQEMIASNKRLVMMADGSISGSYDVNGKQVDVFSAPKTKVENTYNLGDTALIHNWDCTTRYNGLDLTLRSSGGAPRLFGLNQFHSWGSSAAHAGDKDNNLTWLQRRVERYCGEPSGWRNPSFLVIDFNQVGDAFPYAAALSQGGIFFYEGNGADRDRDTTCVIPGNQGGGADGVEYDLRLTSNGCENDEIRSLELEGIAAGTRIELYDSPGADRQDDFTYIDVKQSIPLKTRIKIDSLEGSSNSYYYNKLGFSNNGLDGKVSRIKVRKTPALSDISDGLIVFHEGNGGTQNIVCSVPFDKHHQFQMGGGNNSYGCDNDEIRSATIVKAGKGSVFIVTGHPDGSSSQGRTAVTAKRAIDLPVIVPSFNGNFENDAIKIEVSGGGGLDGKISYAYFQPASEPDPGPDPEPEPDPGAPPAPVNLHTYDSSARPVKLMWNPSARAVKYKVFWYFKEIGETTGTELLHNDTDSVKGRYHVIAIDSLGRKSPKSGYFWLYDQEGLQKDGLASDDE